MRNLPKPTLDAGTVYIDCTDTIGNSVKRSAMQSCKQLILDAAKELEEKVLAGQVHTILREKELMGIDYTEFKKLYDDQMVKKKEKPGWSHYCTIYEVTDLCPYCGHREVETLDHFLPKAFYPRLSVVPINLVPACYDCNLPKNADYPKTKKEQTLHPYFDNIENDQCLRMSVNRTTPVTMTFSIVKCPNWTNEKFERVSRHFETYELNDLYSKQAARELSGKRKQLLDLRNSTDANSVAKFLLTDAASRYEDCKNSWQTAFYNGLANDNWFCDVACSDPSYIQSSRPSI
jgi:5-methylcytosine-specific restriction endonuclease McrA